MQWINGGSNLVNAYRENCLWNGKALSCKIVLGGFTGLQMMNGKYSLLLVSA